jgi:hypothetical protein
MKNRITLTVLLVSINIVINAQEVTTTVKDTISVVRDTISVVEDTLKVVKDTIDIVKETVVKQDTLFVVQEVAPTEKSVLSGLGIKYEDLSSPEMRQTMGGKYAYYESKDGSIYKIGDKLTIGTPSSNKTFAFITEGDGVLFPVEQLGVQASGNKSEIKNFWVTGNKRAGFEVVVRGKSLTGLTTYSIRLENAIAAGEIKSFGMTSDEALTELKKAKDKLDLGLITTQEYDSIKVQLVKYIK